MEGNRDSVNKYLTDNRKTESFRDRIARFIFQIRQAQAIRAGDKPPTFLSWLRKSSTPKEIAQYERNLSNDKVTELPENDLYNPSNRELEAIYPVRGNRPAIYDINTPRVPLNRIVNSLKKPSIGFGKNNPVPI